VDALSGKNVDTLSGRSVDVLSKDLVYPGRTETDFYNRKKKCFLGAE
jgi:hypothetical protein